MLSNEFFTWNRVLNIAVMDGRLPSDELRDRTLSFTFTDQSKEFDYIEWELDNSDGMLTRPEYIGVGLFVAMQLGYPDCPMAYRVFVINRMTGGVGVWGRDRASVGEAESKITFHGRNRNAPGGKTGHRGLPRTATAPRGTHGKSSGGPTKYNDKGRVAGGGGGKKGGRGGRKTYGPTLANGTIRELILDQKEPERWIPAEPNHRTSDAVRAILMRHGFTGDYAVIQDTPDTVDSVHVLDGESDGEYLQRAARSFGFDVCKMVGDAYHFHKLHWQGSRTVYADILTYGSSPDILNVTIDCDFQLPVPVSVQAKSYNPRIRAITAGDIQSDQRNSQSSMGMAWVKNLILDPAVSDAITRAEVIPALVSSKEGAEAKAEQWFTKRHMRAFQLSVDTVGNPKLLATRLVKINGTGSPFVDGAWIIGTARHTISGNDYKTSLRLTHPKKADVANNGTDFVATAGDLNSDRRNGVSSQGISRVKGFRATAEQKAAREQQWGAKAVELPKGGQ